MNEKFERDMKMCLNSRIRLIQVVVQPDDDVDHVIFEVLNIIKERTLWDGVIRPQDLMKVPKGSWVIADTTPPPREMETIMRGDRLSPRMVVVSHSQEPISKGVVPIVERPPGVEPPEETPVIIEDEAVLEAIDAMNAEIIVNKTRCPIDMDEIKETLTKRFMGVEQDEKTAILRLMVQSPNITKMGPDGRPSISWETIDLAIEDARRLLGI